MEEAVMLRRGPWTVEEDLLLVNYISVHGEGRWNTLARCSGLRRTGKSCRLRWLNYLRPDLRRGDFSPEEQLLILHLHSRWGNRWSKIAQQLPGRTDNEIKNYWRTRVQKHAKQLRCAAGSDGFDRAVRNLWMPRLLERIQHANSFAAGDGGQSSTWQHHGDGGAPPTTEGSATSGESTQVLSACPVESVQSSDEYCSGGQLFDIVIPGLAPDYWINDISAAERTPTPSQTSLGWCEGVLPSFGDYCGGEWAPAPESELQGWWGLDEIWLPQGL